jgi:hypothetical protein
VICAVGAGTTTGGAVTGAGGAGFFLQPATATMATSRTKNTTKRLRRFTELLLPHFANVFQVIQHVCPCFQPQLSTLQKYARRKQWHQPKQWDAIILAYIPSENVIVKAGILP